ncbi:wax ester/triacylglycerol synthase domain-containing protein [Streptomyces sp. NPDC050147]|uniref:wax ester/triacylglycerol synthase domain-containing protein n=1 Tax=Streptomyces sp. NPDC050147 TaxID=3155513 RepID=UPI0034475E3E
MALLFTGRPPSLDDLRARVAERWGGIPLMRRSLLRPGQPSWLRRHRWQETEDVDLRVHVAEVRTAVPCDGMGDTAFTALLARLVTEPVPDGPPPWRLRLVRPGPDQEPQERFAVILTAHHALMDGRSLERLLSGLLDGGTGHSGTIRGGVRATRTPRSAVPAREAPAGQVEGAGRPLDTLRSGRALPLPSGPPRPERGFTWAGLDTDTVRAARRTLPGLGATLNELVLAASAGALRAVHGPPDRWPGAARPLYGMFSVDLRTPEQGEELGNLVSVVRLPLPVAVDGSRERLRACRDLLAGPAPPHDAHTTTRLVNAVSRLGPWGLRLLIRRAGSPGWAPVACTVIRWPRGPWSLEGAPLERVIPLAPVQTPNAVGVNLTDYARTFTLTVTGHTPEGLTRKLADAFGRELASLAHSAPELRAARHGNRPS